MSSTIRLLAMPAVTLVAALSVAGCGSSEKASSDTQAAAATQATAAKLDRPIKIGAPLALTGFVGAFDNGVLQGAKLAIEEINAAGGVLGQPIEIDTEDTKSDPAQVQSAALAVIGRGADFVLPTMDYDFGGPSARAAAAKKLIAISTSGDTRFGAQGISPYTFNLFQGNPTEGATLAEFAKQQGLKSAYVLTDTFSSYGKQLCSSFDHAWKELDGTVAGKDTFQATDQSIAAQVSRLRQAKDAGFVVLCSFPPGAIGAVAQIRAAGVDLPILTGSGFDGTTPLKALSKTSDVYAASVAPLDPPRDPQQEEVFEALGKQGVDIASPVTVLTGYSAVQALAKAIEEAGTLDSDAVKAKLETFADEPLAIGPTTWTVDCHVPVGRPFSMVEIDRGKQRFVEQVQATQIPQAPC